MSNKKKDTLEIWSAVDTTDPQYTTKVNQRGGFTAIGAQYQLKKATEQFGPFGKGWGVGGEVFHHYEEDGLFLYTAMLWYKLDGFDKEYKFPINSSIIYKRNGRIDDDFAKKVTTDALTKGLSKLGFNADVFMGKFDDNKYVSALTNKNNHLDSDQRSNLILALSGIPDESVSKKIRSALDDGKITPSNYDATMTKIKGMFETDNFQRLQEGMDSKDDA